MILAIDPGCTESAYVLFGENGICDFGKVTNEILLEKVRSLPMAGSPSTSAVIEMVASYGMAVGKEVFETVFWIGRFYEILSVKMQTGRAYRKDIKLHLCNNLRAKDSNIRQALIDRFGPPGTKNAPGVTYGIKVDIWQALAVAVYWYDLQNNLAAE